MAGLVVWNLGGGDFCFAFVDDALWEQISNIGEVDTCTYADRVGWLSSNDTDVPRPKGCPERVGRVLATHYTQSFVIEKINFTEPLRGIVTL
jgi:hypothetical protein